MESDQSNLRFLKNPLQTDWLSLILFLNFLRKLKAPHLIKMSISSDSYYGSEIPCRDGCHHLKPCFNIKKADRDRRLNNRNASCLEFIRSAAMCGTGVSSLLVNTANQVSLD